MIEAYLTQTKKLRRFSLIWILNYACFLKSTVLHFFYHGMANIVISLWKPVGQFHPWLDIDTGESE